MADQQDNIILPLINRPQAQRRPIYEHFAPEVEEYDAIISALNVKVDTIMTLLLSNNQTVNCATNLQVPIPRCEICGANHDWVNCPNYNSNPQGNVETVDWVGASSGYRQPNFRNQNAYNPNVYQIPQQRQPPVEQPPVSESTSLDSIATMLQQLVKKTDQLDEKFSQLEAHNRMLERNAENQPPANTNGRLPERTENVIMTGSGKQLIDPSFPVHPEREGLKNQAGAASRDSPEASRDSASRCEEEGRNVNVSRDSRTTSRDSHSQKAPDVPTASVSRDSHIQSRDSPAEHEDFSPKPKEIQQHKSIQPAPFPERLNDDREEQRKDNGAEETHEEVNLVFLNELEGNNNDVDEETTGNMGLSQKENPVSKVPKKYENLPPRMKLKSLLKHLRYVFLELKSTCSTIVNANLNDDKIGRIIAVSRLDPD